MTRAKIILFAFLTLLFTLTGCSSSPKTSSPIPSFTPPVLQTIEPPTFTPAPLTPTATPEPPQLTPIVILQPTSLTPTGPTSTPFSRKFPIAELNINSPGPDSRIASPLSISAYALPGDQGKVTVQLWGEDGGIIGEQLMKLGSSSTEWITFTTQIPFEITSAGENALLALTTYDGYGRRISVNSVPLLLLQLGNSSIENSGFTQEPIVLQEPAAGGSVSGGTLHLSGYIHSCSSAPIIVELIKTNKAIVASRQIEFKPAAAGTDYATFSSDLSYKVNVATPIRITLRQTSDLIPGQDCALSTVLVTLQP